MKASKIGFTFSLALLSGLLFGWSVRADIVKGDNTMTLAPMFFDTAASGGGDWTTWPADFDRSFGTLDVGAGGTLLVLHGFGWYSAISGGYTASNMTVTVTYLGADGAAGGADDVVLGTRSASMDRSTTGAGEWTWVFDPPMTNVLDGLNNMFRFTVTPDGTWGMKNSSGTPKLSAGGTSTALASPGQISRSGVTISNANISITQSPDCGGAVVSFTFQGTEFIDINDLGRLMQCSSYCNAGWKAFTTDGYTFDPSVRPVINPNQAGDALRIASYVYYVNQVNSATLESMCVPREWFTHSWPGLDDHGGARFETARFVNTIKLASGYSDRVAQLDYQLTTPVSGSWRTENPALYLLASFNRFYGIDAVSNQLTSLTTTGIVATPYRPGSGIGGIVASTAANGASIGIFGAYESKGGNVGSRFVCYNFGSAVCTKIGTETGTHTLSAGQIQASTTYIVTGTSPTDVKNTMVSMYNAGLYNASAPMVNTPPKLNDVGSQTLIAGQIMTITNVASDTNLPVQSLTYSLVSAPPGAGINPTNGVLSWRPTIAQSPGTNLFSVRVTDDGSPSLSATQTFQVTVTHPAKPVLGPGTVSGGMFSSTVGGDSGPDYILQASTNFSNWQPIWTNHMPTLPFLCKR